MKNPYIKKWKPSAAREVRAYPEAKMVSYIADKFGAETNEDGEFSSPELTAWYVKKYTTENRIKNTN